MQKETFLVIKHITFNTAKLREPNYVEIVLNFKINKNKAIYS